MTNHPPRSYCAMPITIVTRSLTNPDLVTRKTINWNNSSDRIWLGNHTHWAMNNKSSITLAPTA